MMTSIIRLTCRLSRSRRKRISRQSWIRAVFRPQSNVVLQHTRRRRPCAASKRMLHGFREHFEILFQLLGHKMHGRMPHSPTHWEMLLSAVLLQRYILNIVDNNLVCTYCTYFFHSFIWTGCDSLIAKPFDRVCELEDYICLSTVFGMSVTLRFKKFRIIHRAFKVCDRLLQNLFARA